MEATLDDVVECTLDVAPEIEATLKPEQCPKCGFVNNVRVTKTHFYAEDGVMNGVSYQLVEAITIVCQECGTQYIQKKYW
ncbi:MAG: hypothetical protein LBC02_00880 [Planctomycetaceae bacterium]|jgi:hypothetical protein|nr:hypothetical protein [Planctomycetaceae bacterium]